jgi:gliotoxin biosynthesis cytochrome P450 monooxygenase
MKLSLGPELPSGSVICVDVHQIPTSESLWESPETFGPMRFYNLRRQPGNESRYHFTSLGSDTPGWGDGPQACPGRTFAASTLKITLAHLIMNYDFRLPPGGQKPKRDSMPNGSMKPDMMAQIMFKERELTNRSI